MEVRLQHQIPRSAYEQEILALQQLEVEGKKQKR